MTAHMIQPLDQVDDIQGEYTMSQFPINITPHITFALTCSK